jgi:polyisoprenoid-binding protein YceI
LRCALAAALLLLGCAATPSSAAHWTVDSAKSRLAFTVAWSGEPFTGVFKSWKADIDFDPAALGHSKAVVTVDLASEASDSPDDDDGLNGALGFAVDRYPQARFETVGIKRSPNGSYVADSKLTIRGVTKPVALPFTLAFEGNRVHMVGKTVMLRSNFGVGQGEWTSAKPVAHEVTVSVDLTATKS